MKKNEKTKTIIGFTVGIGTGAALREVPGLDFTIPYVPLNVNKASQLGCVAAGGIIALVSKFKKSNFGFATGIGLALMGVINILAPKTTLSMVRRPFRINQRGLTPQQRRAAEGRREAYLSRGVQGRSSNTEYRQHVAGLDPQARDRLDYKEASITSPPVKEAPMKPYPGYRDPYTVASQTSPPVQTFSEIQRTVSGGRLILA